VVPSGTKIEVLVTSDRNLHAFSVDAFWVKVDAIPGKINQTWFEVYEGKEGTYYGQCAELCGINHYFMPIEVRVVTKEATVTITLTITNPVSLSAGFIQPTTKISVHFT